VRSTDARFGETLAWRLLSRVRTASATPMPANFIWMLVGHVIYSLCQWLMLTVLAKMGSADMVGNFSGGLAVTAPIIMLANLQLRAVQSTDAQRTYAFGDYRALRLISTAIALAAIAAVAFLNYGTQQAWIIVLVGLAKGAEALSDVHYGLFQQREQMRYIALSLMIRGVLSVLVLAAGVALTGQLLWGVAGMALVWLLVLLIFDVRNGIRLLKREGEAPSAAAQETRRTRRLLSLAKLALPLGIVMMLISLNSNIPRYFVESSLGSSALGYYSALVYLQVAGNTVVLALGQSASPRLAMSFATGNRQKFLRVVLLMLASVLALSAGGLLITLLWGRPILSLLYTPEYGAHATVLSWVMAGAGVLYVESVLGYVVTAMREFKRQVLIHTCGVTALLVLSAVLIPRYGLVGAAQVVMGAAAVRVAIAAGVAVRGSRKRFAAAEAARDESSPY